MSSPQKSTRQPANNGPQKQQNIQGKNDQGRAKNESTSNKLKEAEKTKIQGDKGVKKDGEIKGEKVKPSIGKIEESKSGAGRGVELSRVGDSVISGDVWKYTGKLWEPVAEKDQASIGYVINGPKSKEDILNASRNRSDIKYASLSQLLLVAFSLSSDFLKPSINIDLSNIIRNDIRMNIGEFNDTLRSIVQNTSSEMTSELRLLLRKVLSAASNMTITLSDWKELSQFLRNNSVLFSLDELKHDESNVDKSQELEIFLSKISSFDPDRIVKCENLFIKSCLDAYIILTDKVTDNFGIGRDRVFYYLKGMQMLSQIPGMNHIRCMLMMLVHTWFMQSRHESRMLISGVSSIAWALSMLKMTVMITNESKIYFTNVMMDKMMSVYSELNSCPVEKVNLLQIEYNDTKSGSKKNEKLDTWSAALSKVIYEVDGEPIKDNQPNFKLQNE